MSFEKHNFYATKKFWLNFFNDESLLFNMHFCQSNKAALFSRFFFTINTSLIPSFLAFYFSFKLNSHSKRKINFFLDEIFIQ